MPATVVLTLGDNDGVGHCVQQDQPRETDTAWDGGEMFGERFAGI